MASGASTEPPPLPPADYTPVTTEEWARTRMPPLKGVIVDPEYPPTAEEALQAIRNHDRDYESQWQGQQVPSDLKSLRNKTSRQTTSTPSTPISGVQTPITSSIETAAAPTNPHRSSGSSRIFGQVAGDPSTPSSSSSSTTTAITATAQASTPTLPSWQTKPPADVTAWDILTSLNTNDFRALLTQPCFRETLLSSLAGGFLAAGTLWTLGKQRRWIVNGGLGVSAGIYAAVFPYCMWQRRTERRNTMLVKETWEETRAEKRAAWEAYKAKKRTEDEARERERAGSHGKASCRPQQQQQQTSSVSWRESVSRLWSSDNAAPRGREG